MADPGGVGGLPPPPQRFCFFLLACQYMKIPVDLDPTPPPPSKNSGPKPPSPLEEFRPRTSSTPPPPDSSILRSAPAIYKVSAAAVSRGHCYLHENSIFTTEAGAILLDLDCSQHSHKKTFMMFTRPCISRDSPP